MMNQPFSWCLVKSNSDLDQIYSGKISLNLIFIYLLNFNFNFVFIS